MIALCYFRRHLRAIRFVYDFTLRFAGSRRLPFNKLREHEREGVCGAGTSFDSLQFFTDRTHSGGLMEKRGGAPTRRMATATLRQRKTKITEASVTCEAYVESMKPSL
jgi:hypothetical protein